LAIEDWERIGHDIPLLVNMQPAGTYLGEEYYRAGGLPAVINELIKAGKVHESAKTVNGRTIGDKSAVEPRGLYLFPRSLDNGFRNITTSTKPIETVEDLAGLKIRVPPAPLWVSMFKALGASPTSISLAELYSALQTKIVDGQENPLVQIETVKIYEVQKYCSMTGHVWDGNWVAANGKRWTALPEDARKLISDRFDAAAVKQREDVARLNTELETSLKQK